MSGLDRGYILTGSRPAAKYRITKRLIFYNLIAQRIYFETA
jgi:hypothetical protein